MTTATALHPLTPSPFAERTDPATLTLRRRLPGPVETVWAYLTDGALRRQWLAAGAMTLQPSASFELVWRNDELSDRADERPEGFSAESRATCRITELEPLRRLRFDWPGVGDVSFQLDADGSDVLLTVTHRRLPDHATSVKVAAGWHMHLDVLMARASGKPAPSFWRGWRQLCGAYEQRIGA